MTINYEVFGFESLALRTWGGAKSVCDEIIRQGRQEEAMKIIEKKFCDVVPTEHQVNEFIWIELEYFMDLYFKIGGE